MPALTLASATVIAGILGLTGVVAGGAIQARSATKAGEMAREDWREMMAIEEEQRKKDNLRETMKLFQNTINKSTVYKSQVGALWSGRRAA